MASLPIHPAQAALLRGAHEHMTAAQHQMQLVFTVVLAGHGLTAGDYIGISGAPDAPLLDITDT